MPSLMLDAKLNSQKYEKFDGTINTIIINVYIQFIANILANVHIQQIKQNLIYTKTSWKIFS